jgi:hypothetical protein
VRHLPFSCSPGRRHATRLRLLAIGKFCCRGCFASVTLISLLSPAELRD